MLDRKVTGMSIEFTERVRVSDLIELHGGPKAFAAFLGVSLTAVGQFRRQDTLPPKRALQVAKYYNLCADFFHDPWVGAGVTVPRASTEVFRAAIENAKEAE